MRSSGHRLAYLGAPQQTWLWESHWRIRYNEAIHPSAAALQALLDDLVRIPLMADSDSIPIADSVPGDGGHVARVS